jgi:hypothetical protein
VWADAACPGELRDVFAVYEHTDTGLASVLGSAQPRGEPYAQVWAYQLLRALKFAHSADVVHRALRPWRLRVTANCELRVTANCELRLRGWAAAVTAWGGAGRGRDGMGEGRLRGQGVARRWRGSVGIARSLAGPPSRLLPPALTPF